MTLGVVQRGYLGVRMEEINSKLVSNKGLNNIKGVYVYAVLANRGAAEAGIKEGDVITQIEGIPVNSIAQSLEIIGEHRPGDKLNINYTHDGQEMNTTVTLKNEEGNTKIIKEEDRSIVSVLGGVLNNLLVRK